MSDKAPVAIGSTIAGKYRVERVLGQGGMGVVVVAMHDELDQRVAIKFLLPEALTDAEWVARFSREAKAAARIRSEHAVKVYDVGKLDSGAPYMVMEYLEGRDLQTVLNDRRALPTSEAVEYVLQACEALAEAHAAGVVHRDLKPANLFLTHRADGSTCVKILDFGISKLTPLTTGGGGAREQTVTNTTAIVGSPLYMSPEQMRASKNVDRRTDIWSLGVIMQELVTGSPSFVANTTAELCALVLTAPPDRMPRAAELEAVVGRCLEKTPEKRYASVAELARALEPFGPPSVKTSVERIVRLEGARAPSPSISGPVSIVPSGQSADVSSLGKTEMSDSGAPVAGGAPVATQSGTAAAWGSSRPAAPKSRLPLVIAAGVVAAAAVLGVVALVVSSSHKAAPAETAKAEPKPPAPSFAPAVAVPAPTVTATVTAPAAATLTAATTATAAPTPTTPTPTPTHARAPATARPTSTAKHTAPVDTTGFGGRN